MKKKHHQKEAAGQEARPKPPEAVKRKPVNLLPIIIIIILGFAIYANSLGGKFAWDDEYLIKFNSYLRNFSYTGNIFKSDIGTGSGRHFGFYRPIQMLSYAIDYHFWKLDERGYHLTNIILHILAAIAVYILGFILFEETFPALFASILFLVHPDATAVVSYISGRADSLAILFMLAAFIFYIRNLDRDSALTYILMMASYSLALLSKELCLILPALIIVYHYAFKQKIKAYQIISVLAVPFIYILLRLGPLKHIILADQSSHAALIQRLPGFLVALANYAKILVVPLGLHMEYGNGLFNFSDPRIAAGIIILAGLIFWAIKKRGERADFLLHSVVRRGHTAGIEPLPDKRLHGRALALPAGDRAILAICRRNRPPIQEEGFYCRRNIYRGDNHLLLLIPYNKTERDLERAYPVLHKDA